MYAVIGAPADRVAVWAADRLRSRLGRLLFVPSGLLALGRDLRLSIDADGEAAALTLADGSAFGPATVAGLFNRVVQPPQPVLGGADAAYAAEELWAISLAFLGAFGARVVNRPDPASLAGREYGAEGWRHLAALAGLPALPVRLDARGSAPLPPAVGQLLVIGDRVLGSCPALAGRAHDLARLAGLDILGLYFAADGRLLSATAAPDLSAAGDAAADALAALLRGRP